MNKYQLYTLGGALLAATSLSGAAQAGSVGHFNSSTNTFTAGSVKISNTALSPTAATANASVIGGGSGGANSVAPNFGFLFTNTYSNTFNLYITIPVTGATFVGTPVAEYLITSSGSSSIVATANATALNGTAPTVSALGNQIFISNVQLTGGIGSINGFNQSAGSIFLSGVVLQGVTFSNASGLATAGGTISLGATVASQANQAQIYETIAPAAIVTSVAPITTTVSAGTAASVIVGAGTTQFTQFTGSVNTVTLATISVTGTGALATDLSTTVTADGSNATVASVAASGSLNISVTSAAFADPAAVALSAVSGGIVTQNLTVANFSGGTATFSLEAIGAGGTISYTGTTSINLTYSGTTAISAAAAGTVTVTYSVAGDSVVAPAGASGATTVISRGGLSTQVDWANSGSGSGFTSYLRIHNSGTVAAPATIVLKQDTADGSPISTVGTYTTPTSVPAGGTIQVSVPTIEAALGVTVNAAHSYTLLITGAFPGYVQHLSLAANGSLVDLDGFRSAGVTTP